jgi:hypothetical protein
MKKSRIHELGARVLGHESPLLVKQRLNLLDLGLQQGFIGAEQHAQMKTQLQSVVKAMKKPSTSDDPFVGLQNTPKMKVLKKWFDWEEKRWKTKNITVHIAEVSFAKGAMRSAFAVLDVSTPNTALRCVAKKQTEGYSSTDEFESDIIMQSACQAIANAFNAKNPIKKVCFLETYLIEKDDGTLYSVEPYMEGDYIKYNNNYGYVDKDKRNTPQAFSHFSYEFTEHKLMIVDVQGVGDAYTDPQVHTADGQGFGQGNLGQEGIEHFLKSHRCNAICVYMSLPFHVPRFLGLIKRNKRRTSGTEAPKDALPLAPTDVSEDFHVSEYLSDLQAIEGSAGDEDLSLLGISSRQYDAIANVFVKADSNSDGFLTKDEVIVMVGFLDVVLPEAAMHGLIYRLDEKFGSKGKINFCEFICCWTGND